MPILEGDYEVDGVDGTGPAIKCEFLRPGYGIHSLILPTGNPIDILNLKQPLDGFSINSTLVKAGNPTVFVNQKDLNKLLIHIGIECQHDLS
jgi:2-methylaconitate cis-trans-isomerase PrpF